MHAAFTPPIGELIVLYDAHCGLCRWCRDWLRERPQLVPLRFLPAGSPAAVERFPGLDHARSLRELTAVAPGGRVFHGLKAWIMVLWALEEGREWALRFATPWGRPLLRSAVWTLEALRTSSACEGACRVGAHPVRGVAAGRVRA